MYFHVRIVSLEGGSIPLKACVTFGSQIGKVVLCLSLKSDQPLLFDNASYWSEWLGCKNVFLQSGRFRVLSPAWSYLRFSITSTSCSFNWHSALGRRAWTGCTRVSTM